MNNLEAKTSQCPLCYHPGLPFYQDRYYRCTSCKGIFLSSVFFPSYSDEKKRYELHKNDINDPGHQAFVTPLVDGVLKAYLPSHTGLDYGAGKDSVVSWLLSRNDYQIEQFDPFFQNDPDLLNCTYDYIICCEVIEHFHHPGREFERLKKLLRQGGSLFCMTALYHDGIDFGTWYYKDDLTHVFFYSDQTIQWITRAFQFREVKIEVRVIQFCL